MSNRYILSKRVLNLKMSHIGKFLVILMFSIVSVGNRQSSLIMIPYFSSFLGVLEMMILQEKYHFLHYHISSGSHFLIMLHILLTNLLVLLIVCLVSIYCSTKLFLALYVGLAVDYIKSTQDAAVL